MMKKTSLFGGITAGIVAGGLVVTALSLTALTGAQTSLAGEPDRVIASDKMAPRCLDGGRVGRIHVVDSHTLLVYDDARNGYKLTIDGPCTTMTDMSHIGFEFNGSDQICRAHDAFVLHSEMDEAPLKCIINGVQPLTRAEADALDQG